MKISHFHLWLILILVSPLTTYPFKIDILYFKNNPVNGNSRPFTTRTSNEGILLHIANEITSLNKVFFKAYILKDDAKNTVPSKDLYVQVIDSDGGVVTSQFHRIESDVVEGVVNIPKETPPGKYSFRAYTKKMLQRPYDNFVERFIYLFDDGTKRLGAFSDSIRINVEGGTLIAGTKNRVIVYRPSLDQKSSSPKGWVFDDEENLVSDVNMYSESIGTVMLKPILGKAYFLKFEDGRVVPLPKPMNEGYSIHVNNLDSRIAVVQIIQSPNSLKDSLWLSGRIGGKEFFRYDVQLLNNTAIVNIDKRRLPTGMLMLRLNSIANGECAVRPLFIQNPKLNVFYERINDRETPNSFRFRTTDSIGGPVSSKLAVSINRYNAPHPILSSLNAIALPSSINREDLTGTNQSLMRSKNFIQDLYLQIEYGKNANGNSSSNNLSEQAHNIKEGLELAAYVYDLNNNLLENTPIQIFMKSDEGISIFEVQSDSEGFILLQNLDFTGIAEFTFRTEGANTKSRLVKAIPTEHRLKFSTLSDTGFEEGKILDWTSTQSTEISNDTTGLIKLDETIVTEKRINKIKGIKSIYGIEIPGKRVKYQNPKRPKSLPQLLVEMPGVYVTNSDGTDPRVNIPRLKDPVLWVVDGYALPQDFEGKTLGYPPNSLLPVLEILRAEDIDRIDLLIGADASIFGTRASGGVFSITTRSGSDVEFINRKDARLFFKGYEPKIDFEEYTKSLPKKEKKKSMLLYWNPKLQTGKNGESTIRISTTLEDYKNIKIDYSSDF